MDGIIDTTYVITKLAEINSKIKTLEIEKEELRDEIKQYLYEEDADTAILTDKYGEEWKATYKEYTRKKVDYDILFYEIGEDKFNEIVSETNSVSLTIRKAPKKKKTPPVPKSSKTIVDTIHSIPKGKIE